MSIPTRAHTEQPFLANTNLNNRPFARETAEAAPELWRRYVEACERERREVKPGLEESRDFQLAEALDDAAQQQRLRELEIADAMEGRAA